jgi:hypothetical protein
MILSSVVGSEMIPHSSATGVFSPELSDRLSSIEEVVIDDVSLL